MRFFLVVLIGFFLYTAWPTIEEQLAADENSLFEAARSADLSGVVDDLSEELHHLAGQLAETLEIKQGEKTEKDTAKAKKPALDAPAAQLFSIYNIEIGDAQAEAESQLGSPKRSTVNEYGMMWHAYHQDYQNFFMVSYDSSGKVAGLYTNQDLITSANDIKLGSPRELVLEKMGEPLSRLRKGNVEYLINSKGEYDVFHAGNSYVTVFYDLHKGTTVTALQIIEENMEHSKTGFFGKPTEELAEAFELQLFDVTNATRVNHALSVLTWDSRVRETAKKHSADMAANNFFDHTNREGESPFDRMAEDQISFTAAGENLAYGQTSSIFAHEGLMNSEGHRKNILGDDYRLLGVGVAFNSKSQPFYTENFYAK